jgi:phage/plasmid-associated DNA primase
MTFKLSKADIKRREGLTAELRELAETLVSKIADYNIAMMEQRAFVEDALTEYNEKLDEARNFAEDIAHEADEAINEKSETWQESERGEAACAWRAEWEDVNLYELRIELPDAIADPDTGHADDLDALSSELEY